MKQSFKFDKILSEDSAVCKTRRLKLIQAREKTGKSSEDLSAYIGIPTSAYYDLEEINGELTMIISLGELSKLSLVLGIRTRSIFDDRTEGNQISPEQLSTKLKAYITATGMSTTDFEDRVGFVVAPVLDNPSEILNWNVDCLRFVCEEVGLDWRLALP